MRWRPKVLGNSRTATIHGGQILLALILRPELVVIIRRSEDRFQKDAAVRKDAHEVEAIGCIANFRDTFHRQRELEEYCGEDGLFAEDDVHAEVCAAEADHADAELQGFADLWTSSVKDG